MTEVRASYVRPSSLSSSYELYWVNRILGTLVGLVNTRPASLYSWIMLLFNKCGLRIPNLFRLVVRKQMWFTDSILVQTCGSEANVVYGFQTCSDLWFGSLKLRSIKDDWSNLLKIRNLINTVID